MSKVLDRLKQLYALAIVRPEEEKDECRQNEARNAAFTMLKYARENGVEIKFTVRREPDPPLPPPKPVAKPPGERWPMPSTQVAYEYYPAANFDVLRDFMRRAAEKAGADGTFSAEAVPRTKQQVTEDLYGIPFDPAPDEGFRRPPVRSRPKMNFAEDPVRINAQFQTTCVACRLRIIPGQTIWWAPSRGATHAACGPEAIK